MHANVLQVSGNDRLRDCFAMLREPLGAATAPQGLRRRGRQSMPILSSSTPKAPSRLSPRSANPLAVWKRGRRTVSRPAAELHRPN